MVYRKFDKSKDLNQINSWLSDWNMTPFDISELPEIGLIIDDIAVCFLYKTDSTIANIENLVVNKNADKETRSLAIELIGEELINIAKCLGFKFVFSVTNKNNVIEYSEKHGFTNLGTHNLLKLKIA